MTTSKKPTFINPDKPLLSDADSTTMKKLSALKKERVLKNINKTIKRNGNNQSGNKITMKNVKKILNTEDGLTWAGLDEPIAVLMENFVRYEGIYSEVAVLVQISAACCAKEVNDAILLKTRYIADIDDLKDKLKVIIGKRSNYSSSVTEEDYWVYISLGQELMRLGENIELVLLPTYGKIVMLLQQIRAILINAQNEIKQLPSQEGTL